VFAENHVRAPLTLQHVAVTIDGEQAGGVAGNRLGQRPSPRVAVASITLPEGEHSITLYATAVRDDQPDRIVLHETQRFSVGRGSVSLVARLSARPGGAVSPQLDVAFTIEGGALQANGVDATSSCHALDPDQTQICLTKAMLRDAIQDHDAPRVVCLDEILTRMRELSRFRVGHRDGPSASPHETEVGLNISHRITQLGDQAGRCPTAKPAHAVLGSSER